MIERLAALAAAALERAGLGRLARAAPVRALGRRLLVGAERSRVRVVGSGAARGIRLTVLRESPQSYWLGTHEPETQHLVSREVRAGDVVYDCGANIGFHSALFARLVGPGGHVFAFEPSPESVACLATLAPLNGFNNLTVVPRAVWRSSGALTFVQTEGAGSTASDHVQGALGAEPAGGAAREVPCVSLDDFHYGQGHPAPQFLKVDVEGAESDALAGAARLLHQHRPRILLEVHGPAAAGAWAILTRLGYHIRDVVTGAVPGSEREFAVWIRQYFAVPA